MGELADFARDQSDFITLKTGESFGGIYKGHKFVASRFDPEKQVVRYKFEIGDTEKAMDSGNKSLMYGFDGIDEGTQVLVKRTGEGVKTKYEVEVVE